MDDIYKLIELLNDRYTELANSYRVLNDSHAKLEVSFVKFETKVNTAVSIMKYFVPSSLILSAIAFIIKLAELVGWIG